MITKGGKEYPVVDLGCGEKMYAEADIGIDIYKYNDKVVMCDVGFSKLPFEDGSVGKFYAKDFLEHIPTRVDTFEFSHLVEYPVIYTMNEIWRCLCIGGEFESYTPVYPNAQVWQDPTHVSVWTKSSMDYFCKGYEVGLKEAYGIQCQFEKRVEEMKGFHFHSILMKL